MHTGGSGAVRAATKHLTAGQEIWRQQIRFLCTILHRESAVGIHRPPEAQLVQVKPELAVAAAKEQLDEDACNAVSIPERIVLAYMLRKSKPM